MLSRRTFAQGLTTLVAGFTWRPAWAVSGGHAAAVPFAVSARMSDLADWWEEAGRVYDTTKPRHFTAMEAHGKVIDTSREDYKRWREAERSFVYMTVDVLEEPSRSQGDVIFKYHVIDMLHRWRQVGHWLWVGARDLKLAQQLEQEAEQFGVAISPLWGKTPSPFATIDGERHSLRWAVISRWRVFGALRSIIASAEAAFGHRTT